MSSQALGPGRIHLSRVVFGCMWSGGLREPEIHRLVHAAIDHGITSFDTAPLYDFHGSEQVLGRALRDRRSRVEVLTKAGLRWDGEHGRELFQFTDAQGTRRIVRKDSRPPSLRAEVEASLLRLGVEQIDLLQIHHPDIDTKIADSVGELVRLRDEGKVRAIGVSNYSPDQLCAAIVAAGPAGLDSLQCEYNLLERWAEDELLPLCRAQNVGVLAFSPLAKGVLAGAFRARNRTLAPASRGSSYGRWLPRGLSELAVALVNTPIAKVHATTPDQVALSWLLLQPGVTSVVCGASTLAQVESNARAMQLRLDPEECGRINAVFAGLRPALRGLNRVGRWVGR